MFLNSIARPELNLERGLAPRGALPAAQLPLERHEARVTGPTLQQRCVRNDGLVPAGVAARAHQVSPGAVSNRITGSTACFGRSDATNNFSIV